MKIKDKQEDFLGTEVEEMPIEMIQEEIGNLTTAMEIISEIIGIEEDKEEARIREIFTIEIRGKETLSGTQIIKQAHQSTNS